VGPSPLSTPMVLSSIFYVVAFVQWRWT